MFRIYRRRMSKGDRSASYNLLPLTPSYSEEDHSLYVDHLRRALEGPNPIRNIALTGSYGTGKSSVLQAVVDEFGSRVISISLPTLGAEPTLVDRADNGAGTQANVTNRIQKEIVKQLLYREPPSRVPGSRYKRIGRFRWWRQIVRSIFTAVPFVALMYLTGLMGKLAESAGDNTVLRGGIYSGIALLVISMIVWIRYTFYHGIWVDKLGAGPATISLSAKSGSYFDEYLDEIVYFFEVIKADIVIFEDLDRFDDALIFETLRELNTILNKSKQIKERQIRFIYAIKDSIFERLGSVPVATHQMSDAAVAEVARANRTKFFDLVIPLVPFITHRTARDLMATIMSASHPVVSTNVVEIAAKHVADMRLIKNVRNEFCVFGQKLLAEGGVPGLNVDTLFAMILYKNIHLSDFELIKTGASLLDELYKASRKVITEGIARISDEERSIRDNLRNLNSIEARSSTLGVELEKYIRRVIRHIRPRGQQEILEVSFTGDGKVPLDSIQSPDFWRSFIGGKQGISIRSRVAGYDIVPLDFTFADIREALDEEFSVDDWKSVDRERLEARLATLHQEKDVLARADMRDLFKLPQHTVAIEGRAQSFAEIATTTMDSKLAIELIQAGYINRNFTLYASQYYGVHVSLQAMSFILHNVQPGTVDLHFKFSSSNDIAAILNEFGTSILEERSMYNVEILDYLLEVRHRDIDILLNRLTSWEANEQQFIQAYVIAGKHSTELLKRLAGRWSQIFLIIAHELNVDELARAVFFSSALSGAHRTTKYRTDGTVAEYIEKNYFRFDILTSQIEPSVAANVVGVLNQFRVKLDSLRSLHENLKVRIINSHLYKLSEENLRSALGKGADLALDNIWNLNEHVFDYAMDALDQYLTVVGESSHTHYRTIVDPSRFVAILQRVSSDHYSVVKDLVAAAAPECQVEDVCQVPIGIWAPLAETQRFLPTWNNITAYIEKRDGLDSALAILLQGASKIVVGDDIPEPEKLGLATRILRASDVLPSADTRVRLVESLDLREYINVNSLTSERGKLIGLLLAEDIIKDSAETYQFTLKLDWETREFALANSPGFAGYATSQLVPPGDISRIFTSSIVPEETKDALLAKLADISTDDRSGVTAAAAYASDKDARVHFNTLSTIATAGIGSDIVLRIVSNSLSHLSKDQLVALLTTIGSPYDGLTTPSRRSIKLHYSNQNIAILRKLQEFGLVSSFSEGTLKGSLRVNMRRQ